MQLEIFEKELLDKLQNAFVFDGEGFCCDMVFEEWLLKTLKEVNFSEDINNDDVDFDFAFIQCGNNLFTFCLFFLHKGEKRLSNENRLGIKKEYAGISFRDITITESIGLDFFYRPNLWEEELILIKSNLELNGFLDEMVGLPNCGISTERQVVKVLPGKVYKLSINVVDTLNDEVIFDKIIPFYSKKFKKYRRNKFIAFSIAIAVTIALITTIILLL